MSVINLIFNRNKTLGYFGLIFLCLSVFLSVLIPFNTVEVLGINSIIKPLKFSISIWVFCWTMAVILHYFHDKKATKRLIIIIIITMIYEQSVITIQGIKGKLSHFNTSSAIDIILFQLMGFFITVMTLYILWLNIKFHKQKDELNQPFKIAVLWAVYLFVFSALMGGVMGYMNTNSVGGKMGEDGLPFINWSTKFGDLRVGHFFGIHSLQIIPAFAVFYEKTNFKSFKTAVIAFSGFYTAFVMGTFIQAILKQSFISWF